MNGWFPRLNRAGDVVSGAGEVWCRGQRVMAGTRPKWLSDTRLVALGQGDRLWAVDADGTGVAQVTPFVPLNHIWGCGGGEFSVAAPGEIAVEHDPVTGQRLVILEQSGNNDRAIFYGDRLIVEHAPVLEARAANGHVVWRQWPHPTRIMGWRGGAVEELVAIAGTWCGWPVPVITAQGPWVAWITNEDIRLCPWDGGPGYIIPTGADCNLNPDAVGLGDVIRVAWNDKAGKLFTRDLSLSVSRVDVRAPLGTPEPEPQPEPTPTPAPEESNVKIPDAVYDVFERLLAKFGVPLTDPDGRAWIRRFAEQLSFSFPGAGYGHKSADPNRPPSADVVAQQHPTLGLIGWDMFTSLGSTTPEGAPIPPGIAARGVESIPLPGQSFIPVSPVNHLGAAPPQEPPEDPPQPDPALVARVAALEADVTALKDRVEALARTGADLVASMAEQTDAAKALTEALAEVNTKLDLLGTPEPCVAVQTSTGRTWGHSHSATIFAPPET